MGVMDARRRILLNAPHIITPESSSLVTFDTDMVAPLKECKVHFSPVQEGSGDPSPENVRPIKGWTGLTAYRIGQNIWDEQWEQGNYNASTGEPTVGYNSNIRSKATSPIPVKPNTSYYVYIGAAINVRCLFYTKNDEFLSAPTAVRNGIITSPPNARLMRFYVGSGYGGTYGNNIAINYPATATAYEPYQGQTHALDWTDEAGTVYGGYVDLVTGEVWETYYEFVVDGTLTPQLGGTSYNGTEATNRFFWLPRQTSHTSPTITVGDLFCDKAVNYERGTWSDPNSRKGEFCINAFTQLHVVFTNDVVGITEEDSQSDRSTKIKAWLTDNPMTFVLPLRWPTLVTTLTPTELRTLIGTNNIWSTANGNVTAEYWTR